MESSGSESKVDLFADSEDDDFETYQRIDLIYEHLQEEERRNEERRLVEQRRLAEERRQSDISEEERRIAEIYSFLQEQQGTSDENVATLDGCDSSSDDSVDSFIQKLLQGGSTNFSEQLGLSLFERRCWCWFK